MNNTWTNTKRFDSSDKNVFKYVFSRENAVAESVLYRYPDFNTRTVICCSTMSGCPVGCRFCGSGDYFNRNLTGQEIVDQVLHCLIDHNINTDKVEKLQIMFMSMGEPLLNWQNLGEALFYLKGYAPNADLLISTMGPDLPASQWADIVNVSKTIPKIGLQFSVHESTDEARDKLIPFKKKLTLGQISDKGFLWHLETKRKPFFNYCASEHNTSDKDADRLRALFPPNVWECTISVVCERNEHVAAANKRQEDLAFNFMQKMLQKGFNVRLFNPAGQDDIGGGCGQLWYVQDWMKNNPKYARPSIGKGLNVIHAPTCK